MDAHQLERLRECCLDDAAFERLKSLLNSELPQQDSLEQGSDSLKELQQQKAVFEVINRIRQSSDLETIFVATAREVRQLLGADRVGMFRFYPNSRWNDGEFVSEDVVEGCASALAVKIHDHCFGDRFAIHYVKGHVQAVADIHNAGLSDCHIEVLSRFQIRANLVVPLIQGETLWGLLCIHQCTEPRHWQESEIEFVKQIAAQLSVALHQAELLQQTQQQAAQLAHTLNELKKTQTQLIQGEKMSGLGLLVAGVAHEINNPVNFIHGNLNYTTEYIEGLLQLVQLYHQRNPQSDPEIEQLEAQIDLEFLSDDLPKVLSSMKVGTDRIRQIILSLKNFSRLDQAEMKPVNIHEGIDSTLLILHHRLKARSDRSAIQVIRLYGDLPPVECYAGQLNQVFMNLLSNAIEALEDICIVPLINQQVAIHDPEMTTYPTITIRTQLVGSHVVISLMDNGPGIPDYVRDHLFDPFFTTKPIGQGTGLGLAISSQIVTETHGGKLECFSEVGQGTEFRITIPVKQNNRLQPYQGLPINVNPAQ